MKFILVVATLLTFQIALADLTIQRSNLNSSELSINVTGEDAKKLQKYFGDLNSSGDFKIGAKNDDYSSIRSIRCTDNSCDIVYAGRAYTNKDAQDFYNPQFNKKIKSMTNSQVLISHESSEGPGSASLLDAKVLRVLFENSENNKDIKLVPSVLTKKFQAIILEPYCTQFH